MLGANVRPGDLALGISVPLFCDTCERLPIILWEFPGPRCHFETGSLPTRTALKKGFDVFAASGGIRPNVRSAVLLPLLVDRWTASVV